MKYTTPKLMITSDAVDITTVDISSSGEIILAGSSDTSIRLFERWHQSYKEEIFYGHQGPITKVQISPLGRGFLSCGMDGKAYYWEYQSKKVLQYFDINKFSISHAYLTDISMTSTSSLVLVCPYGTLPIYLWNLVSGQVLHLGGRLSPDLADRSPYNYISPLGGTDVEYSPNGCYAAVSSEKTIFVWDMDTGKVIRYFGGLPTAFFVASNDIFVPNPMLLDVTEKSGGGHQNNITSISFSPDENSIMSASLDGTIKIWNLEKFSLLPDKTIEIGTAVISAKYVYGGNQILASCNDNTIKRIDIQTGMVLDIYVGHNSLVTSMAVCDKENIFVSGYQDGTICLWEI